MIQYTIQDIEKKVQSYYELMIISKQNYNLADIEKFQILYNDSVRMRNEYYNRNGGK